MEAIFDGIISLLSLHEFLVQTDATYEAADVLRTSLPHREKGRLRISALEEQKRNKQI